MLQEHGAPSLVALFQHTREARRRTPCDPVPHGICYAVCDMSVLKVIGPEIAVTPHATLEHPRASRHALRVSQTRWKLRPELDIDLNPDYPNPGRPIGWRHRADEECAVELASPILFSLSLHLFIGAVKIKYIFPRPSFVVACYAYSVLTRWLDSVYSGARSVTPSSKESSKQVVKASSMTPMDVNEISSRGTVNCRRRPRLRTEQAAGLRRSELGRGDAARNCSRSGDH